VLTAWPLGMLVRRAALFGVADRQTCYLACVPGVEGHACACVSKASLKGDHASRKVVIRKKSIKGSMQASNMAEQALWDVREGMFMSTRAAVGRPSSICPQNGESAGRIARCEGPDLVLPSRDSAAAVVWAVAGHSASSAASCPGLVTRLLIA